MTIFVLLLFFLLLLIALVAIVLLLFTFKPRIVTLVLLGVLGILGLSTGVRFYLQASAVQQPAIIHEHETPSAPARILSQREKGPANIRPTWVDAPPQLVDDAYQMSIAIGPYTTRAECDEEMPKALQKALQQYVEICLGDRTTERALLTDESLRQMVKEQWEETREHSVGPMVWLHVLLKFDRKIKDQVLEEHRQAMIHRRLRQCGAWAGLSVGLLAVAFGYLKIDLATAGAYRSRLRLGAIAVMLGLVAVAIGIGNY